MIEDASLRTLLASFAAHKFLFVQPGGNWGDHLIYFGAEQLAKDLGIQFRTLDWRTFTSESSEPDEIIYLHGSGGFNSHGSGRAQLILKRALQTPGATVIQGPSTIISAGIVERLNRDINAMSAARLHFFARERMSHRITEHFPSCVVRHIDHDTAFHANRASLLGLAGVPVKTVNLYAIRRDVEAVEGTDQLPWSSTSIDPARFARSFKHWVRIHAAAVTITTNRAHSAICGAILQTPTTMLRNGYHKNESLWDYSLRDRGVQWSDLRPIYSPVPDEPMLNWIPFRRIRESWRLNRLAKGLRGVPMS